MKGQKVLAAADVPQQPPAAGLSYLLMTMGLRPRLPWLITLLMPFKATILAFMMGSEMESKSAAVRHTHTKHVKLCGLCQLQPFLFAALTHAGELSLWCGSLSDQCLHLLLLLLLLPLLVQEILQEERLLLQEERPWLVWAMVLDLLFCKHGWGRGVVLGGCPHVEGLSLGIQRKVRLGRGEGHHLRSHASVRGDEGTLRRGGEHRRLGG